MKRNLDKTRELEKDGLPEVVHITSNTSRFICMVKNPTTRPNLLARLQELGLLSEFLEVEN